MNDPSAEAIETLFATIDDLDAEVVRAVRDFGRVAELAGHPGMSNRIRVEITRRPHRQPTRLPAGEMAVYAFFYLGRALKVGKVGPKSGPRYTSQHYNPGSAGSNLARSLLTGRGVDGCEANELTIGSWIREQTDRVNLLLPADIGLPMLSLLEAFLHVRWAPAFEGRPSDI